MHLLVVVVTSALPEADTPMRPAVKRLTGAVSARPGPPTDPSLRAHVRARYGPPRSGSLAADLPADAGRLARPGPRRALAPFAGARAAHAHGRPRRPVDLPVLRGRLRPEGLRLRREGRPDRGRPRLADLARAPVSQGRGLGGLRELP